MPANLELRLDRIEKAIGSKQVQHMHIKAFPYICEAGEYQDEGELYKRSVTHHLAAHPENSGKIFTFIQRIIVDSVKV